MVKQANVHKRFAFKACWLWETPKQELGPYLDAERQGVQLPKPPRKAEVLITYLEKPYNGAEVFVDLSAGRIESWNDLDPTDHLAVD